MVVPVTPDGPGLFPACPKPSLNPLTLRHLSYPLALATLVSLHLTHKSLEQDSERARGRQWGLPGSGSTRCPGPSASPPTPLMGSLFSLPYLDCALRCGRTLRQPSPNEGPQWRLL